MNAWVWQGKVWLSLAIDSHSTIYGLAGQTPRESLARETKFGGCSIATGSVFLLSENGQR